MRLESLFLKIELSVVFANRNITDARWNERSTHKQIALFYLIKIDELYTRFSHSSLDIRFPIYPKKLVVIAYLDEPFYATLIRIIHSVIFFEVSLDSFVELIQSNRLLLIGLLPRNSRNFVQS
jgi:hypothetical protein